MRAASDGACWGRRDVGHRLRREIEHFGDVVLGSAAPAVPLADSARWIAVAEEIDQQLRER